MLYDDVAFFTFIHRKKRNSLLYNIAMKWRMSRAVVRYVSLSQAHCTRQCTFLVRSYSTLNDAKDQNTTTVNCAAGHPNKNKHSHALDSMIRVDLAGETAAVRICNAHLYFYPHNSVLQEILHEEQRHLALMNEWAHRIRARPTLLDPIFKFASVGLGVVTALLGPSSVMCCHAAIEDVIAAHYNDQLRQLCSFSEESTDDEKATEGSKLSEAHEQVSTNGGGHSNKISGSSGLFSFWPFSEKEPHEPERSASPRNLPNLGNKESHVEELRKVVRRLRDEEMHHHELGITHGGRDFIGSSVLYESVRILCKTGIWLAKRF